MGCVLGLETRAGVSQRVDEGCWGWKRGWGVETRRWGDVWGWKRGLRCRNAWIEGVGAGDGGQRVENVEMGVVRVEPRKQKKKNISRTTRTSIRTCVRWGRHG
jgi:hypothetical protein